MLGLDLAEASTTAPAGSDSNRSRAPIPTSSEAAADPAVPGASLRFPQPIRTRTITNASELTDNASGGFRPTTVEDADSEESASDDSDIDSDIPSLRTVADSFGSEDDSEDDS